MLETRHARFTYCNLRYERTAAPDAAVVRRIRRSNLVWRLAAVRGLAPLAAVERVAVVEGGRGDGDVRVVAGVGAVVVQRLVLVVGGGRPLMVAVQINCSRRALRMVVLMASAVKLSTNTRDTRGWTFCVFGGVCECVCHKIVHSECVSADAGCGCLSVVCGCVCVRCGCFIVCGRDVGVSCDANATVLRIHMQIHTYSAHTKSVTWIGYGCYNMSFFLWWWWWVVW